MEVQPLQVFLMPECLTKLVQIVSAVDNPDALHKQRREAALRLTPEGRLKAQTHLLSPSQSTVTMNIKVSKKILSETVLELEYSIA